VSIELWPDDEEIIVEFLLITDRTSADVERWRELHDKGWAAMTEDERAEWLGEMKGRYTYTDMNRVENAVEELSARLRELGYRHSYPTTKTTWAVGDVPTKTDMERYFGNVRELRQAITLPLSTPIAPTIGDKLNYERANNLEKILEDIDMVTTQVPKVWCSAGDIFVGEV